MEYQKSMFEDMLPCYYDLSVWSLLLFVGNRRPLRALIDNGKKRIGSLREISEDTLEDIVGTDMMEVFFTTRKMLSRTPQDWICDIWGNCLSDRRGKIVMKKAEGRTYTEIADEEGLSRQRITQIVSKFFAGQEPFLKIIEENLKGTPDYDDELSKVFPDATFRSIYRTWIATQNRKKGLPL